MEHFKKGHGFIPDTLVPDHYVYGASPVPTEVLVSNGQWHAYLPEDEIQNRNGYETCNCTAYGTLNQIEIYLARKYGIKPNFSERYLGVMAGTRPPGNSPHKVMETIREFGLIDENSLPFLPKISTLSEYYSPVPMYQHLIDEGKRWLASWEFRHEWVWGANETLSEKQRKLKQALVFCPVSVSVHAWVVNEKGLYYKPHGKTDQHWIVLYGSKEGEYWEGFDSYDNTHKRIAWDTDFMQAKKIYIEKKTGTPLTREQETIFKKILSSIRDYLLELLKEKQMAKQTLNSLRLYTTAKSKLGFDASPRDRAPDRLACADSFACIYKEATGDPIFDGVVGTAAIHKIVISNPQKFEIVKIEDALPGDGINSPTGYGDFKKMPHGHCGIIGVDGRIMSNSSETGKWIYNFTLETWTRYFRDIGGYPIIIFRPL
jgi:hypothetical protein